MKNYWKKIVPAAVIGGGAAALALALHLSAWLEELEWKTFDLRVRLTEDRSSPPPADIVLVLIDEASLRQMNPVVGRWPWPRSVHADLIDFFAAAGARAVAFDILFTENERAAGDGELSAGDARLAEAAAGAGNVHSAMQFVVDTEDEFNSGLLHRKLPEPFVSRFSLPGAPENRRGFNNFYLPFPELLAASKGVGIVEFAPDRDGIYRRNRLLGNYDGRIYPTLAVDLLLDRYRPQITPGGLLLVPRDSAPAADAIEVPLLPDGAFLIKPYRSWQTFSVSGILATMQRLYQGELENLPVNPEAFRDKIVLIGASAVGVEDLKPLPFGALAPGVFLHASILENILKRDFLRIPPLWLSLTILVASALAVACLILLPSATSVRIGGVLLTYAVFLGAGLLAFRHNLVLETVPPLAGMGTAWLGSFVWLSATEGRQKRRIRNMLGQYVSPAILGTVLEKARDDILRAEIGSREELTILFSDIRGFTTLSEELPAEEVVEILNGYFRGMVDIIFELQGTLDKFIGDAIMAFWGAPLKIDAPAAKGVEAAVRMVRWLAEYNEQLAARGLPPLAIGIGLHTGEVILGNIGSEKKLDYTIIGDNVNLCSRLEGLTKHYGCSILISEATFRALDGETLCRILDVVRVKGKKRPIAIYQVLAMAPHDSAGADKLRHLAQLSEQAFALYLAREWGDAAALCRRLRSEFPGDRMAELLLERMEIFQSNEPPPDWDGVWTMQAK